MAVIALLSAKGAPGCTTTALGLALRWPRSSLLVEADLAGSSIMAGYLRGELHPTMGLVEVATAALRGKLDVDMLLEQSLRLERSTAGSATTMVLPGIANIVQATSVRSLWGELGSVLNTLSSGGIDVIVDVGRVGIGAEDRSPLLAQADLLVTLAGSSLPQVHATQQMSVQLQKQYTGADSQLSPLGLVVVGPDRPYSESEIATACGLRLLGTLPWDSESAGVYSDGAPAGRKAHTRPLNRSLTALAEGLHLAAQQRRTALAGGAEAGGVR